MRNEENIGYNVRDKRSITILSLTYEISNVTNSSFINGSKITKKNKILFLVKNQSTINN